MKINLIAVGKRMPSWVNEGYHHFADRLPKEFQLHLIEVEAEKRSKHSAPLALLDKEGERLLQAAPADSYLIALDREAVFVDSATLTKNLENLMQTQRNVCFFIGGPEGLSKACLNRAHVRWSLSPLTFPHALVRIILAEQIYRAWSIMARHPYHR